MNFTDPSGHTPICIEDDCSIYGDLSQEENLDNFHTQNEHLLLVHQLSEYGVTVGADGSADELSDYETQSNEEWGQLSIEEQINALRGILEAVHAVGLAFARGTTLTAQEAFKIVFKDGITFLYRSPMSNNRIDNHCNQVAQACASGTDTILFTGFDERYRTTESAEYFTWLFAHEMGHVFDNIYGDSLLGSGNEDGKIWEGIDDVENIQLAIEMRNEDWYTEIYADVFMNWVFTANSAENPELWNNMTEVSCEVTSACP